MITVNKGHYDDKAGEEYDLDLLEAAREAAGLAAERSIQVNHLEERSHRFRGNVTAQEEGVKYNKDNDD